jgi:hypothetical protein
MNLGKFKEIHNIKTINDKNSDQTTFMTMALHHHYGSSTESHCQEQLQNHDSSLAQNNRNVLGNCCILCMVQESHGAVYGESLIDSIRIPDTTNVLSAIFRSHGSFVYSIKHLSRLDSDDCSDE